MLMAAKPTPSVMPTKNFPLVNFSLRGALNRREGPARPLAVELLGGGRSQGARWALAGPTAGEASLFGASSAFDSPGRATGPDCSAQAESSTFAGLPFNCGQVLQTGTGTRATMSRTAASASSREGHESVGVRGQTDAVCEHRREVVDVVGDAIRASAGRALRAGRPASAMAPRVEVPREDGALRVACTNAWV